MASGSTDASEDRALTGDTLRSYRAAVQELLLLRNENGALKTQLEQEKDAVQLRQAVALERIANILGMMLEADRVWLEDDNHMAR